MMTPNLARMVAFFGIAHPDSKFRATDSDVVAESAVSQMLLGVLPTFAALAGVVGPFLNGYVP